MPRAATLSKGSGRVGRRAASFVAWSRSRVRPRRWGRVCASAVARRLLRRGIFAAGGQVVGRRRTRRSSRGIRCRALVATSSHGGWGGRAPRWSRGVCCRAVSAVWRPSRWVGADASQARGFCFRTDAAPPAAKALLGGGRVRGRAASVAARSRRRVKSSRWGRASASVGARRPLPRGRGAAGGEVVWRGQTRRQARGFCCRTDAASRAAEALRGAGRVRGRDGFCAASFAVRSLRHVRPRRWGRVCASAVARRLLRRRLFAAGGQEVGRRRTRRLLRGVCCCAVAAPRSAEALAEGVHVHGRAVPVASRTLCGGQ